MTTSGARSLDETQAKVPSDCMESGRDHLRPPAVGDSTATGKLNNVTMPISKDPRAGAVSAGHTWATSQGDSRVPTVTHAH
jgi:hypothetical protein